MIKNKAFFAAAGTRVSSGGSNTGIGMIYTWGGTDFNRTGHASQVNVPTLMNTLITGWQYVTMADQCALGIANGQLYGWGTNRNSMLTVATTNTPVAISGMTNCVQVEANYINTYVIRNNQIYSAGSNVRGMNGNGLTSGDQGVFTSIAGFATATAASYCGSVDHTHFINNGRLYGLGRESGGRMGTGGASNDYSTAVQIGSFTDWQMVSVSFVHSIGIRAGRLYAWGNGTNYQTGLGTTSETTTPTQIGTDTNWVFCAAGNKCGFAIKSNGTLWAWGSGQNYRTGLNTTSDTPTPTQVGTATDWLMVAPDTTYVTYSSGGDIAVAGIRGTNGKGTLYTWGSNLNGRAAQGATASNIQTPQAVGSDSNWKWVAIGNTAGVAIK